MHGVVVREVGFENVGTAKVPVVVVMVVVLNVVLIVGLNDVSLV